MKKTLALSLISMILLTACKKDNKEISLRNKWTLDNSVAKEYSNGALINTTTAAGIGTTLDFQDNGNLVITSPGSPVESFFYTIVSNSRVEFDGDTYEIRNLTGSDVTLFIREDFAPGDYEETFLYLKK